MPDVLSIVAIVLLIVMWVVCTRLLMSSVIRRRTMTTRFDLTPPTDFRPQPVWDLWVLDGAVYDGRPKEFEGIFHKARPAEILTSWVVDSSSYGRLWRLGIFGGPLTVQYVQVWDSTTGEEHLLRVPVRIWTAREAVAWTFGMDAGFYRPSKEA